MENLINDFSAFLGRELAEKTTTQLYSHFSDFANKVCKNSMSFRVYSLNSELKQDTKVFDKVVSTKNCTTSGVIVTNNTKKEFVKNLPFGSRKSISCPARYREVYNSDYCDQVNLIVCNKKERELFKNGEHLVLLCDPDSRLVRPIDLLRFHLNFPNSRVFFLYNGNSKRGRRVSKYQSECLKNWLIKNTGCKDVLFLAVDQFTSRRSGRNDRVLIATELLFMENLSAKKSLTLIKKQEELKGLTL